MADERPRGLTLGATVLLAALVLGVAFAVALLLTAKPAPERGPAMVTAPRGPAIDLRMAAAATLPALRRPKPRKRRVRPTPRRVQLKRRVVPVATAVPAPAPPPRSTPAPRPAPRPPAPTPRRVATPAPTPRATPIPPPEPSGDFDTTGEPS